MATLPPDVQILRLHGAEYYVFWSQLQRGDSFFLPTTATVAQARRVLKPVERWFDFKFEVRTRCEYGRYGVRVWRTL